MRLFSFLAIIETAESWRLFVKLPCLVINCTRIASLGLTELPKKGKENHLCQRPPLARPREAGTQPCLTKELRIQLISLIARAKDGFKSYASTCNSCILFFNQKASANGPYFFYGFRSCIQETLDIRITRISTFRTRAPV